ncbi:hypothetical protein FRB91_005872 [Serendipita sp. 411]|nr:hypothetical protein FRB91_005872 [Serendipita sp. 411]
MVMDDLSLILQRRGQLEEAEALQWERLSLRKVIQGERHPDTALAMYNLVRTLYGRGRLEEAENLALEVVAVLEEILEPDHPHLILVMNSLSSIRLQRETSAGTHRNSS